MPRLKIMAIFFTVFLMTGCRQSAVTNSTGVKSLHVNFISNDGIKIDGRLFGESKNAVILAHMFPSDQTSWDSMARELSTKGYSVLTFDFRGYGNSQGTRDIAGIDRDEAAAVKYMRRRGTKKLFLIGASMGGTASLKQAANDNGVDGVISLSGPIEFQGLSVLKEIGEIKSPVLLIAAKDDPAGAADSAKWFFEHLRGPKEIKIFPGSEHGTAILQGRESLPAKRAVFNFLAKY